MFRKINNTLTIILLLFTLPVLSQNDIFYQIQDGNLEGVKALVESGDFVNSRDKDSLTPLMHSILEENI